MRPLRGVSLLAILLTGSVNAEPLVGIANPKNLTGVKLCLEDYYVRISDTLRDDSERTFAKSVAQTIRNKLLAYRVPISQNCSGMKGYVDLWLNMSATEGLGDSQAKEYDVELRVLTKVPNFLGSVALYATDRSGVTINMNMLEHRNRMSQLVPEMIDQLAADYATSNP